MAELQWENKALKQRLADVGAAVDDGQASVDGSAAAPSVAGSVTPRWPRPTPRVFAERHRQQPLQTPSMRSMHGFSSKDLAAAAAATVTRTSVPCAAGCQDEVGVGLCYVWLSCTQHRPRRVRRYTRVLTHCTCGTVDSVVL